jgi:excisionase family DNA binding protein
MTVLDRLGALADALPDGGTITLTKSALMNLLDLKDGDDLDAQADLTLQQTADRFGRSPSTVRDWIRSGAIDAYKLNRREWRITHGALADFERKQRQGNLAAWRQMKTR